MGKPAGSATGTSAVPGYAPLLVDVKLVGYGLEVTRRGNGDHPEPGHMAVVRMQNARLYDLPSANALLDAIFHPEERISEDGVDGGVEGGVAVVGLHALKQPVEVVQVVRGLNSAPVVEVKDRVDGVLNRVVVVALL